MATVIYRKEFVDSVLHRRQRHNRLRLQEANDGYESDTSPIRYKDLRKHTLGLAYIVSLLEASPLLSLFLCGALSGVPLVPGGDTSPPELSSRAERSSRRHTMGLMAAKCARCGIP